MMKRYKEYWRKIDKENFEKDWRTPMAVRQLEAINGAPCKYPGCEIKEPHVHNRFCPEEGKTGRNRSL